MDLASLSGNLNWSISYGLYECLKSLKILLFGVFKLRKVLVSQVKSLKVLHFQTAHFGNKMQSNV